MVIGIHMLGLHCALPSVDSLDGEQRSLGVLEVRVGGA
jgi:hypothetical protein